MLKSKSAKFNADLRNPCTWVFSDIYTACDLKCIKWLYKCDFCRKSFSIKNPGISQIQQDTSAETNIKNE